MLATRSMPDPDRRWRPFARDGRRLAAAFAALWFGAIAILFRLAPAPAPLPRTPPPQVAWRPVVPAHALDAQALFSPAAFALPTPAGFSHALRDEQIRLAPPAETARPPPAFLPPAPPADGPPFGRAGLAQPAGTADGPPSSGVFPPRKSETEAARMIFPAGWESRLFSGIDLNFGAWTNVGWSAQLDLRFDGRGVPVAVAVAQGSGVTTIDRRLARSAYGWRLLDAGARRAGVVAWTCPAAAGTEAP